MKLNIKASGVFEKNYNATERVVLNVGSSRSSKTYSLCQMLITKALAEPLPEVYTISRKTLPALKASAYRDFLEILQNADIYNPENHNKSDLTYQLNNTLVEFISVDQFDKVKGRKRKVLYMNEANEFSYQDYTQLALRTTGQIFMDLNPSHAQEHWIEEKIKVRDDCRVIHSTYKNNPFLDQQTIFEIERLEHTDPNLWRIYGLGEMGIAEARIFTHFKLCDSLPEVYNQRVYGLDFGFNHPTALIEVREVDDVYYCKEIIYEKGLLNSDLITRLGELGISSGDIIYCDHSRADHIQEIKNAGFNAQKANKAVEKGIDTVKSKEVFLTKDSTNCIKESGSYSYKTTTDGKVLEEPVKINDDACFTADTEITVPIGVKLHQESNGYKDVYNFMGSKVTANHPYLTPRGFVRLDCLRYSDKIVIWKGKLLMELSLDDTQTQTGVSVASIFHLLQRNVSAEKQNVFTGIYGKKTMVKYPRAFISIIKTTTHLIMTYLISNLLHLSNTISCTIKKIYLNGEKMLKRLFKLPVNGVKQKKDKSLEKNGVKLMQNIYQDIELNETAISVERDISQRQSLGNSATIIAKLEHCGKEEVFSTTTSSGFFLANGVVVKNCDALRYGIHSMQTKAFIGFV